MLLVDITYPTLFTTMPCVKYAVPWPRGRTEEVNYNFFFLKNIKRIQTFTKSPKWIHKREKGLPSSRS
jgi:hypothetical protein